MNISSRIDGTSHEDDFSSFEGVYAVTKRNTGETLMVHAVVS